MRIKDLPPLLEPHIRQIAKKEHIHWMQQPSPKRKVVRLTLLSIVMIALIAYTLTELPIIYIMMNSPFDLDRYIELILQPPNPTVLLAALLLMACFIIAPLLIHKRITNTVYLITDDKAYIVKAWPKILIGTFGPLDLTDTIEEEYGEDEGSIYFTQFVKAGKKIKRQDEAGFVDLRNIRQARKAIDAFFKRTRKG